MQLLLPRGQFPNALREKNYLTNSLIKEKFSEKQLFSVIDMERDTAIIGESDSLNLHEKILGALQS